MGKVLEVGATITAVRRAVGCPAVVSFCDFIFKLNVQYVILVVLAALVDGIGQASKFLWFLLVNEFLNFLDPRFIRLIGLHPAALIPNDILVCELANSLDLLHRWVL